MRIHGKGFLLSALLCCLSQTVLADIKVSMSQVAQMGPGNSIGYVTISQTKYGLLFTPNLRNLTPGVHGFHVHASPSCDNFGLAAQGHLDPNKTGKHLGPYDDNGHLGDLPVLIVDSKGQATLPVLAPRLVLQDVEGHSLMIHAGGDNYSDQPQKMGGGGDRFACGIIPIIPSDVIQPEKPAANAGTNEEGCGMSAAPAATPSTAAPATKESTSAVTPLTNTPTLPSESSASTTPDSIPTTPSNPAPIPTENSSAPPQQNVSTSENGQKLLTVALPPEQQAQVR